MSPKPVDPRSFSLPRALETLRRERPDPQATARVLAAIRRPAPRRRLARPLAFAMIATALALVVFMPRAKAGSAWAQTLARTLDAPASHAVERWPNGRVGMEEWRSDVRRAHVLYRRDGTADMEWRDDGRHLYNFASRMFQNPKAPNSFLWGDVTRSFDPGHETPYGSPEALLREPGVEVVAHESATGDRPETYRLRVPLPFRTGRKRELVAELEPKGGRIVRLTQTGVDGATTIDYPASIPASVFEPRPQAIPHVAVFSGDEERRIQRDLRLGIAKRGPIVLRTVILTGDGDLWAFWTGALPDPKLAHPFTIPGVRSGSPFTNRVFTTGWQTAPKMNGAAKTTGPRLGGMGRTPLAKLGPTVDLDVPYAGGVARFRHVPYVRIGLIQHVSSVLGAPRDYR